MTDDDVLTSFIQNVNRPKAPSGGLGWWLDYVCRLIHFYPSFTLSFVLDELAMDEGWAYYVHAVENGNAAILGAAFGAKMEGPNYIAQEVDRLIAIAVKKGWGEKE